MLVQGMYTVNLPISMVWKHILDRAILEEVTPGVSELVEVEPNVYDAISKIKLGPVQGSFKGRMHVQEIKAAESFVLSLTQNSSVGSVQADITVTTRQEGDQTVINYEGNANLTGVLGRLGQRVLGGVVHSLANQFFNDFEKKIKEFTENHK